MKTQKFSNMHMGTRFWIETGDAEFDYEAYKISAAEFVPVHDAAYRETVSDTSAEYRVSGRVQVSPNHVTDIERVAITLLYNAYKRCEINHPVFRAWVEALATNPHEYDHIDQWASVENIEFECSVERFGAKAYSEQIYGDADDYESPMGTSVERAAFFLANAVRTYRMMGRPSGDTTHSIQGMGGTLMNVSTSLAAAIAEYHERIRTNYEIIIEEMKYA